MKVVAVRSASGARALFERIVFGPEPPIGVTYRSEPTLRCRIGLHRMQAAWDLTRVEAETRHLQDADGSVVSETRQLFQTMLARPPDYHLCGRCGTMAGIRGQE